MFRFLRNPLAWLLGACLGKVCFFFLDSNVIVDDMRQFGAALRASAGDAHYLLAQSQIAYFASVLPVGYRGMIGFALGHTSLGLVALLKLLAVLSFLATAFVIHRFSRALLGRSVVGHVFTFFVIANLLMTAQVLSGTPRDLGTFLFMLTALLLLEKRWILGALSLFLLSGVYPAFGLLILATVVCVAPRRVRWVAAKASLSIPAAGLAVGAWISLLSLTFMLGLKLLGPAQLGLGPVLEIFRFDQFGYVSGYAMGWSELLAEMFGSGHFKLIHSPSQDPLRWAVLAVCIAAWSLWRCFGGDSMLLQEFRMLRSDNRFKSVRVEWTEIGAAFVVASLGLYLLALLVAYRLHAPSRYTTMLWIFMASAIEAALVWDLFRDKSIRLFVIVTTVGLCFLALPVGLVKLPSMAFERLRAMGLDAQDVNVFLVSKKSDRAAREFGDALPLIQGWRSFYLPGLDKSFHLRVRRRNELLRMDYEELNSRILAGQWSPSLGSRLEAAGVTHLLAGAKSYRLLSDFEKSCFSPVPMDRSSNAYLAPLPCFLHP